MKKNLHLSYQIKRLSLRHPWKISRNSSVFKENLIVKLQRDGITGYGEAAPNIRYKQTPSSTASVLDRIIPIISDHDPWNYVELGSTIRELTNEQTAAAAAVDIALFDWLTKSMKIPLYKFLGTNKHKTPITSYSIGIDSPEMIREKVAEGEAFPVLKVKLGTEDDEAIIQAVRSVTDKPLRVDANEGWKDKHVALKKIQWLTSNGVELIEQPMPAHMPEAIRWLRRRVDIPIIADEAVQRASDIPALAPIYDGINIKLMKAGGIQEAIRMIWMAKSLGMLVMIGCMIETAVAISAAAAISPLVDYADLDGNLLIFQDPFFGVHVENGKLILAEIPGIGVHPKQEEKKF